MKWLFFFILGRNLDVLVEEESEEEEVDEGYKREVSCNIIGYEEKMLFFFEFNIKNIF